MVEHPVFPSVIGDDLRIVSGSDENLVLAGMEHYIVIVVFQHGFSGRAGEGSQGRLAAAHNHPVGALLAFAAAAYAGEKVIEAAAFMKVSPFGVSDESSAPHMPEPLPKLPQ